MDSTQQFDNAYWLHQPHEVRALRAMTNSDDRAALAESLAARGFTVDIPIGVMGYSPYLVMMLRKLNDWPWAPPLGRPPIIRSAGPGQPETYDLNAPAPPFAIMTSVNIADYPPIDPPIPPPAPTTSSPIHALAQVLDDGTEVYFSDPDDHSANGTVWPSIDVRPHFVKTLKKTLFGDYQRWTKVP